jgi:hypothetical protein
MSENLHGLLISAEELARIQAACQERAAELEAAGTPRQPPDAAGSSQGTNSKLCDNDFDNSKDESGRGRGIGGAQ